MARCFSGRLPIPPRGPSPRRSPFVQVSYGWSLSPASPRPASSCDRCPPKCGSVAALVKIILLDHATGKGNSGAETYYGFSIKSVDLINAYLSTTCRKRSAEQMTDKQERYFSSCCSQVIRKLFQYLLQHMNSKNGVALTIEKEIGIQIEESVRIRQLQEHRVKS